MATREETEKYKAEIAARAKEAAQKKQVGPAVAQRQYPKYKRSAQEVIKDADADTREERFAALKERSEDYKERDLLDPYEPGGEYRPEALAKSDIEDAPTRDPEEDYDTAMKRVRGRLGRGQIAPAIRGRALKLKQRREAKKVLTPEKFKQAKKAVRSGETAKLIAAGPIPVPSPEDFPGGE